MRLAWHALHDDVDDQSAAADDSGAGNDCTTALAARPDTIC
jgi:hypothetical protein